ncbi:MAG: anti-sigma factor [Alphaproteobacteria bacterium]|nr:anti-sigma factor [Alphaproteobacteria bacterium]
MTPAPGCDMVLLAQAELDGELDAAQAASLQAHRARCAICQGAQAELLSTRKLLRSELSYTMPAAVRQRVMARLAAVEPALRSATASQPSGRTRARWLWLWPTATGFAAGAACTAALAFLMLMPGRENIVDQLVAGHIRALQPGHLEDVVSADQHTVKPWFDGRLDFAPPVKDFAAQGFPLKGGRLDYAHGRPVAALVYQRDKHIINVFVWPEADIAPQAPANAAEQGYNIVHWSADGMSLWAVSDVERKQLDAFAELWRHSP